MNCSAVVSIIVNWLRDYAYDNRMKGFVLGVSGGVDSALVSTLCCITKMNTFLLTLPIHQSEDQVDRGDRHIAWLKSSYDNVSFASIDLTATFEKFRETLPHNIQDDELSMANLRSRLRMSALYAYANHNRYLVVGTGNKIEDYGVMYFTLGGDGQVDLSPIGDLSKSQVWELSKNLGINKDIISAKPTDGLWKDNRWDEDALGASYAELEWAMAECSIRGYKINGQNEKVPFNKSKYSNRECEVLHIYLNRNFLGQHKVRPIPICKIPPVIL